MQLTHNRKRQLLPARRSGGKDIPPIRNTMHQVKLHQTAFMANRVKWIRCKLQVIVDFSARFGEKNTFGHCQNIQ